MGELTALSNLAPACAPYFSASFSASFPRPGSSDRSLEETECASAVGKWLDISIDVRKTNRCDLLHTFGLPLGDLGLTTGLVEVVANSADGSDAN